MEITLISISLVIKRHIIQTKRIVIEKQKKKKNSHQQFLKLNVRVRFISNIIHITGKS
jgi:hypothetical protein